MKLLSTRAVTDDVRGRAELHRARGLRPVVFGAAPLVILLAVSPTVCAQDCPPETFEYGQSYGEEVEQIVIDHYGAAGPVAPVAEDCARAARDLGVIRAAYPDLVDVTHESGVFGRRLIFIETRAPSDPALVCTNLYYQVEFWRLFDDWWVVRFPRPVNAYAVIAIYDKLPTVINLSLDGGFACTTGGGCCGYYDHWDYSGRPNGVWRWTATNYFPVGPGGQACAHVTHTFYVSESGQVFKVSAPQAIEGEPESGVAGVEGGLGGADAEAHWESDAEANVSNASSAQ